MQLFYREKGIDTHPPLIILHGLWGASDNWLPVADLLSHRFHVILPDQFLRILAQNSVIE